MTGDQIAILIERTRLLIDDEKAVQAAISERLTAAGVDHEREVRLSPRDVIDFVCVGRVGIEVKIKGGRRAILRQVERYAASDQLVAIVVVTAVAIGLPLEIAGKPISVVSIGRAWL